MARPLLASYAHIGEAPWHELAIVTLNLTLASTFLSVVRFLGRSVWPAAFGHDALNTALVFAYSAPLASGFRDTAGDHWR